MVYYCLIWGLPTCSGVFARCVLSSGSAYGGASYHHISPPESFFDLGVMGPVTLYGGHVRSTNICSGSVVSGNITFRCRPYCCWLPPLGLVLACVIDLRDCAIAPWPWSLLSSCFELVSDLFDHFLLRIWCFGQRYIAMPPLLLLVSATRSCVDLRDCARAAWPWSPLSSCGGLVSDLFGSTKLISGAPFFFLTNRA